MSFTQRDLVELSKINIDGTRLAEGRPLVVESTESTSLPAAGDPHDRNRLRKVNIMTGVFLAGLVGVLAAEPHIQKALHSAEQPSRRIIQNYTARGVSQGLENLQVLQTLGLCEPKLTDEASRMLDIVTDPEATPSEARQAQSTAESYQNAAYLAAANHVGCTSLAASFDLPDSQNPGTIYRLTGPMIAPDEQFTQ